MCAFRYIFAFLQEGMSAHLLVCLLVCLFVGLIVGLTVVKIAKSVENNYHFLAESIASL